MEKSTNYIISNILLRIIKREIIQNALEKFKNIFFVLMEADKYNCLIRAEALTNDPVTQDIVKRTNDMCLKHGIYLMPR